jgi:hypothetical protein
VSPIVFEAGEAGEPTDGLVAELRRRLAVEHRRRPFVASDARDAVQRSRQALEDLAVTTVTFRGGLQLRGAEVDHVWLAVSAADGESPWVLDVAFPLFAADFVELLPRYVVGEIERTDLDRVSRHAALEQRVLGRLPPAARYCGEPVWSVRHADG